MRSKIIFWGWVITVFALFLYSFTQIDLGLTLTRASFWQPIQKSFQYIGYFNRPLSGSLYLLILVLLFLFYFLILAEVSKNRLSTKQIWQLIFINAGLLWLAYNAFSYDLFNYIFDARIVTKYHLSPYSFKALDFPGDPMLGFMHWTHRLFPYGPIWLLITVSLSFLGMQKLLLTMVIFKALGILSYLMSCWSIDKILSKIYPKNRQLGLAIFAFSPLVIIEGLISVHNDVLMMGLALLGFWFLLGKKYLPALLLLIFSAGIKFVTAALIPVFVFVYFWQRRKAEINWEKILTVCLLLMGAGVWLAIRRDEFKPWYLLYPFVFLSFLPKKSFLFWLLLGLSAGALLHYAPFLFRGNWNPPVPEIKTKLTWLFGGVGILAWLGEKCGRRLGMLK